MDVCPNWKAPTDSADESHIIRNDGTIPEIIRETFSHLYVTHGKSHGTGLGTYQAKLIAQAHGGKITFKALNPGRAEVYVYLPELSV